MKGILTIHTQSIHKRKKGKQPLYNNAGFLINMFLPLELLVRKE